MSELNSTQKLNLLANHPFDFVCIEISILVVILGSGLSLFMIKNNLAGLNFLIKSMLYVMAGQTFTMCWISLVITIVMQVLRLQTFTTCIIFFISRYFMTIGNLASIATISQVRYYIALKTTQLKAYKKKTLQFCIVGVHVFVYVGGLLFVGLTSWYGWFPPMQMCMGSNFQKPDKWFPIPGLLIIVMLICILIGLIGDLCLMNLIWKRKNMIVPGQLIPWKSTSKADNIDMKVPVHATLLSIVSLVLVIIVSSITLQTIQDQDFFWYVISFVNIWCGFVIPFIIMKVIKTKKQNPVIPNILQMHDENENPDTLEGDQERNEDFKNNKTIVDGCIEGRSQSIKLEEFKESENLEICKGNEDSEVVLNPRKLMSNDNFEQVSMIVD